MVFALDGGINPGAWEITQARATITVLDPRPITRRSLDLDFMRPNFVSFGYRYLINGPNGFLASNANINLDASRKLSKKSHRPALSLAPPIPKAFVGDIVASVFYHVTDNILLNANSVYDVVNNRFIGVRGGVKLISPCDCWTMTLTVNTTINPAQDELQLQFQFARIGNAKEEFVLKDACRDRRDDVTRCCGSLAWSRASRDSDRYGPCFGICPFRFYPMNRRQIEPWRARDQKKCARFPCRS